MSLASVTCTKESSRCCWTVSRTTPRDSSPATTCIRSATGYPRNLRSPAARSSRSCVIPVAPPPPPTGRGFGPTLTGLLSKLAPKRTALLSSAMTPPYEADRFLCANLILLPPFQDHWRTLHAVRSTTTRKALRFPREEPLVWNDVEVVRQAMKTAARNRISRPERSLAYLYFGRFGFPEEETL
jgi:hypothetical protein